jgi:hypothetical protein
MQPGYQGRPSKGYSESYGQRYQGKKPWRQQPQSQYYGQGQDDYYGQGQFEPDPRNTGYRDYQDEYRDSYHYSREEKSGWEQQDYQDEYGGYYQGQRSYHPGGDYHHGKRNPGQKVQHQQKPYQKGYQQQQPPVQRNYPPQQQGSYSKRGYTDPNMNQSQGKYSDKPKSGGQSRYPQQSQKESVEDMAKSSKKGSSVQDSQYQQPSGGQGATKPAFGQYYTQKRFMEQEQMRKQQENFKDSLLPGDSASPLLKQMSASDLGVGKVQTGTLASVKKSATDQTQTKENASGAGFQNELEDERFCKTMAKFNTLDRGTYFVREDNKKLHFMVNGRADLLGWKDTYVINGYLLHGVVIKLLTLTSRVFLFIENLHSIYKEFIKFAEDGETALWTDAMPDLHQIVTVTCIEKVEVMDNDEEGFEGFVCYTICEDSKIEFNHTPEEVDDWNYVQDLILLYEPTSIRKIYLDMVYNSIYKPESKGFGGKRIAAIVNPHVPGETIQYSKNVVTALDKKCVVGTIWIQNGRYTLIAETVEDMERLVKLVDMALDIAEELDAYVMITNLRRTFDYVGKTVLYISSDPTLKLIRSSNAINFANKIKKSENLT